MEAQQEKFKSRGRHDEWGGFPEMRLDPAHDPFARMPRMWSATSQHFLAVAVAASGAGDLKQWSARLSAAQEAMQTRLADARRAGAAAQLCGWGVSPATEPGLTIYALTPSSITAEYPKHELFAAVAAWLLIEGHKAAMRGDAGQASKWEAQALVCIAVTYGEGAREVSSNEDKSRRSDIARSCANAGHIHQRRRKEQLFADYRAGSWPSKSHAADELAIRHHFAKSTVRKLLQGI